MASFANTAFSTDSFDTGSWSFEVILVVKKKTDDREDIWGSIYARKIQYDGEIDPVKLQQLVREDEELVFAIVTALNTGLM